MTFSLIGRCAETGMLGVAITTSSICVASRCPWARAGAGAVSTQNVTDPTIGPKVLDLLAGGKSAAEALQAVLAASQYAEYRQVTVIDREGRTAHHSGAKTLGTNAVAEGKDCLAAGNLLGNGDVPKAMATSFTRHADLHLAERLLRGLESGIVAGGEKGPVKSAGLLVVDKQIWPLVDLRVDWSEDDPVAGLRDLWERYQPQMRDYVTRALDPRSAPAYGVPGDP
ncbi:MAG TPA: DUF1028 domain-containing protein [Verrucomicrobiae bacterium]|nr:DUF1028 domain-containing protein [Verrucomicrobiae bacterium]